MNPDTVPIEHRVSVDDTGVDCTPVLAGLQTGGVVTGGVVVTLAVHAVLVIEPLTVHRGANVPIVV